VSLALQIEQDCEVKYLAGLHRIMGQIWVTPQVYISTKAGECTLESGKKPEGPVVKPH